MNAVADPRLSAWQNYYVIIGSSAAALIGIQFIVITLIASRRKRPPSTTVSAFGTPTVVHLAGALIVSAVMAAPSPSLFATSVVLTLCGVAGLVYTSIVIRLARKQNDYAPVWEDWLWHAILPYAAYVAVALALVFEDVMDTFVALFVPAAAALSLLLIGIHNAWDTVTHIVVTDPDTHETRKDRT